MKRLLTLSTFLLLNLMTFASTLVNGIYYEFSGTEATVVKGTNKYTGDVVIPESVTYGGDTYSVTGIGSYAFRYCYGLTSVTIPNSVTNIGSEAFYICSGLTSVTIGNSVTSIGEEAFSYCSGLTKVIVSKIANWCSISFGSYASNPLYYSHHLYSDENTEIEELIIPNSVTSIGNYAFTGCSGLTSVTIGNSVTNIGSDAFGNCSELTSVTLNSNSIVSRNYSSYSSIKNIFGSQVKSYILGDEITSIGSYAFDGCSGLTSVTIGNSVTSIGNYAFSGCSGLTSVTIPNSVTSTGNHAFSDCSGLTSVTIPNSVTSIGGYAFSGCSGLTSVTIPNSVTSIGGSAFYNCSGLTSVTWNAKKYADFSSYSYAPFSNKTQITEFKIGEEVEAVPSYLCYGMTGLTSVAIPNSVTSIGEEAFYNTRLKSVTIGAGVLSIGSAAFSYDTSSSGARPVKVIWLTNTPPSGYANAAGTVNYVSNNLYTSLSNKTVYPFLSSMFEVGGVKYVPVSPSERNCDAIDCAYNETAENINIGETVSYQGISMKVNQIKPYACYENEKIKEVKLSFNGNIGAYAFEGCTSIKIAVIKNKGNIGEKAFYSCTTVSNPATFEIANSGSIGNYAFSGCKGMQSAVITNNGSIGDYAFQYSGMQTATLGEKITSLGEYAFSGCSNLQSVVIPDAVMSIGQYSFEKCSSMTSAKIGSGVTTIPTRAFSGCSALNDMQIGQNVQTIDTYAFAGCKALESITIPKSVTNINNNVFDNCSGLKKVIMEDRTDDTMLSLGYNYFSSSDKQPLFSSCPLDEVYIGRNISYSTSSSDGSSPFYRNTSLRSVTITDRETEISPNEFYGCTNLKEVKIGDGVTTIGNRAFSGCSSLDFFSFGSAVQTIGQEGFSDCTAMTKLISKAANPPTCGTQALDDINKWTCILQVPAHTLSLYQAAPQWKEFFFIEEATGIKGITGDNTSSKATITTSYDLNGKQLSQPQKGLNILKMSDGTTRKVVK